ncbi:immunity protein YezG family protein [Luteolibacter sp. Populi]|uniref:immunity protein YezG family protein n=1 Tax=Luteolibacter sp. Populi TaxID=3230487 RepID=UPI0034677FAF
MNKEMMDIYQKIGDFLDGNVTEEWEIAWVRSEIDDGVSSSEVYYKAADGVFHYEPPSDDLDDAVIELWELSAESGSKWFEMTYKLSSMGEMDVSFRYEEMANAELGETGGRAKEWIYENLGDVKVSGFWAGQ